MTRVNKGRIGSIPFGEDDVNHRLNQIQAQLDRLTDVVNYGIEFGDPQDPADPTSQTILAGVTDNVAGDHNGTPGNIFGAFVELSLTTTGIVDKTCYHNLYRENVDDPIHPVPVAGEPNCRWLLMGIMHDGATTLDGTSTVALDITFVGGTVAANSIVLRTNLVLGGTNITVNGTHPVQVTLFFTRATRGE